MKNNFKGIKYIYFIGIGGISMSSLAFLMNKKKYKVAGSDRKTSNITKRLVEKNIKVYIKQSRENITSDIDLVVYTSAISDDNVELIASREKNIRVIERAVFLQIFASEYKNIIAISGTHGKTTTCGMIYSIFEKAKKNPTLHIGGIDNNINANFHLGENNYFITEACEYKKHLLCLTPTLGVVINIDKDHMECYKDYDDLKNTFKIFLKKSKKSICPIEIARSNDKTFSISSGDYFIKNIIKNNDECYSFDVYKKNKFFVSIRLNVMGKFNIENALVSVAVSDMCKIDRKIIKSGIEQYSGTQRRFEVLGKIRDTTFIRDYAHVPKQINACMNTVKDLSKNYAIIFQPHTYSRTANLIDEFTKELDKCDNVFIYKTFPAREKASEGMSAKTLCSKLKNATYINSQKALKDTIKAIISAKIDYVVFVGAGDIGVKASQIYETYNH